MNYLQNFLHDVLAELLDFGLIDVLDILVVAVFFYYILLAIRGTRAVQIVQGIVALLLIWAAASVCNLHTLNYLLSAFLLSMLVGVPVVFQPELRRALMRIGQNGLLHTTPVDQLDQTDVTTLVDEIAFASFNLSSTNYGALIVLEQETGLKEVVETGQLIRSIVSAKLLQTIFHPNTPLHDGAVVIRGKVLEAAACYLPLTESAIDSRLGTRHRAAMGISEQTDAIVVVVSEETGEMRIAREGRFTAPMTEEEQLRTALSKMLIQGQQQRKTAVQKVDKALREVRKNVRRSVAARHKEEDSVFDDCSVEDVR